LEFLPTSLVHIAHSYTFLEMSSWIRVAISGAVDRSREARLLRGPVGAWVGVVTLVKAFILPGPLGPCGDCLGF
jgi:hypothetical protein